MKLNTAGQKFHVVCFNNDGRVSGQAANITCTLSKDGGDRVATNDVNPTEIGTTGEYVFELTQAETNAHALSFAPVCSTEGVQVLGMPSNVIYTQSNASLTGDYTLTVTVTDDADSEPIEGATVTLYRSGERGAEATDANGEAVFGVDAATWTWIVRASGYASQAGTKAIAANDTLAVELVAVIPVEVTADTTALTFRVSSQGNASLAGVVASAKLIGEGYTVVGETVGINVIEEDTSDAEGMVTLVLFRESDYDLSVKRTNGTTYKLRIRTSDEETTTISEAIEV